MVQHCTYDRGKELPTVAYGLVGEAVVLMKFSNRFIVLKRSLQGMKGIQSVISFEVSFYI